MDRTPAQATAAITLLVALIAFFNDNAFGIALGVLAAIGAVLVVLRLPLGADLIGD